MPSQLHCGRIQRILAIAVLAVALSAILSACSTVDFDYPKTPTTYIDNTDDTPFGKAWQDLEQDASDNQSAFYLLTDGIESLAARLIMADRAEKTLDAQYYLITADNIGLVFIGSLLDAADRGVRVRLLLDDIQTQGYDLGLAALDAHPNFEIRIFNPWGSRKFRGADIFKFSRLNRRMHNKSFTVDNRATIIGGRNIAAEYFSAREDVNFGDLDVFGMGSVVTDVSGMFDQYWNHTSSVPVPGFAKSSADPKGDLEKLRAEIEKAVRSFDDSQYLKAFEDTWDQFVNQGRVRQELIWANYEVVYDSPDKSIKSKAAEADSIVTPLRASIFAAEKEVTIVSPYFVPQRKGAEGFKALREQGIEVAVVTNSLAANNHAVVHSGYAPAREPLLKMGVRLYEVKANAKMSGVDRGGKGASLATLHTKAFLVDDDTFFLGSFNFDPRSANINTELGIILKSEAIGQAVKEKLESGLLQNTYEVKLDEKGNLIWFDYSGDYPVSYSKEPDTGGWDRFKVGFLELLPIKGQL